MTLDDICQLHDLRAEVEKLGVRLRGTGWGLCPLKSHQHTNMTPSFSVYTWKDRQRWKCHGNCGLWGDVIDLYGYMYIPGYDKSPEMRMQAAEGLRGEPMKPVKIEAQPRPVILPDFAYSWFLPLGDQAREYLHGRGLDDATIEKFKLGSASYLDRETKRPIKKGLEQLVSIPCIHLGSTIGVKIRIIKDSGIRYFSLAGGRAGLFNFDDVYLTDQPVLMMKGELCAAVAVKAGFLACAPTSGEGGTKKDMGLFREIRTALSLARKIVVGDNDRDGRKYAPARADLFDAILKYPPVEFKDWDSYFLARPDECMRMTERWINEAE